MYVKVVSSMFGPLGLISQSLNHERSLVGVSDYPASNFRLNIHEHHLGSTIRCHIVKEFEKHTVVEVLRIVVGTVVADTVGEAVGGTIALVGAA